MALNKLLDGGTLKIDEVMKVGDFNKKLSISIYIYLKRSGRKFIILLLYVDDILLVSNDLDLLH